MKNLSTFLRQCVLALALIAVPSAVLVPALASAATASAAISPASLSANTTGYPYISGTASNVSRVRLSVTLTTDLWTIYKTDPVTVSSGAWHVSVPKQFSAGQYTIRIYNVATGALLTRGTMMVSAAAAVNAATVSTVPGCAPGHAFSTTTGQSCTVTPSTVPGCAPGYAFSTTTGQSCTVTTTTTTVTSVATTPSMNVQITNSATGSTISTTVTDPNKMTVSGPATLKVNSIPLLSGGTTAPGTTVPIIYLQVVNQGDATTTVNGFWIQEDGSTPPESIIGFSTVDDKGNYRNVNGGYEGVMPFFNGKGYAPSGAPIGPHQMKLFTIKAQLSKNAVRGTNLMLNVSGVDAPQAIFNSTFPVQGVTWSIGG